MIVQLLRFTLPAFALGAAGLLLSNRRVELAERRRRWTKLCVYFAIVHLVLLAAAAGWQAFTALVGLVWILGTLELRRALRALPLPQSRGIWCVYAVLGACLLAFARLCAPDETLFTCLVVVFFDGFSQVCGQLFGRRKLAPRLSPGKTVEGALGGLVFAAGIGLLLREAPGSAALLALAALAGDLAASWVKRRCGLKDFGRLLPGHGGVLDRFDSLLGAAPVALLWFHGLH